jgi:hypothetical protein
MTTPSLPPPSWPLTRQQALGADSEPVTATTAATAAAAAVWASDPIWADLHRRKLGLEDPRAKHEHYWKRDELPPLYAAAMSFQNGAPILKAADAKPWLQAALDDLAAKGVRWIPHIQIVRAPSFDSGNTFRIVYGIAGRTPGRTAASLGISDDEALSYIASDYTKHRLMGDVISQPFTQRPVHWTLVLYESTVERGALHDAFIPRVF